MNSAVLFYGWNRPVPGREQISAQHFQDYLAYLAGLQANGAIDSYDMVLLNPHGGDMNGFFLLRGSEEQLNALQGTDEYRDHVTRGGLHLEGTGAIRGVSGEGVMEWMSRWVANLPE